MTCPHFDSSKDGDGKIIRFLKKNRIKYSARDDLYSSLKRGRSGALAASDCWAATRRLSDRRINVALHFGQLALLSVWIISFSTSSFIIVSQGRALNMSSLQC
ncbi:hypothetical protein CDAR_306311 [Caerostris darwini]|uniref:Uncharacterized protein n=1 Tax=Caerostris darwini TaxID=1538125 RepID=A0AAV4SUB7_9ARAC|nr:hypothetical protein CDAR_306311 [Caerostris darwini]